ncbi:hypothetical protein [Kribbella sp. NPDC051770]|uniref:hypothetical protein n=1 Tax=Kribbella sp. NPDC051770 TaxID=3155413 RepID=UPI003444F655
MVRHGAFAYTWDLVGDPSAGDRIASLGVDTVTLQAAYHSVRATTAWHPRHRVVHAEHAAAYFRVRPDRWTGRLRPPVPTWAVEDPDRFGTASAALSAAGLRTEAWMVLTHSSILGRSVPELTVQNAYGERFKHALCPAQAEVREYALTLVREVCEQYDVPALMLEACGWLGFEHLGAHEKTSGADLSQCARDLLSICVCAACSPDEELGARIRTLLDRELQDGVPAGDNLVDALGPDLAGALFAHRTRVIGDLLRDITALTGDRQILLMATDDLQVTGPDVGVDVTSMSPTTYTLKCWDGSDTPVKAAAARTDVPLVANVNAVGERPDELPSLVGRLVAAGASEIRYYHAGLASPARQAAIRAAVQEVQ